MAEILQYLPIINPTWNFLVVLILILFAPMLFERLRIPSIVGLILAGILVGPFGFHILERDTSFELFGKVGLYYIMFLASLEMNLQSVRKDRTAALGFGLLTFGLPMLVGTLANWSLLGYGLVAAVLMAAMYASHTLLAYPIVMRFGLTQRLDTFGLKQHRLFLGFGPRHRGPGILCSPVCLGFGLTVRLFQRCLCIDFNLIFIGIGLLLHHGLKFVFTDFHLFGSQYDKHSEAHSQHRRGEVQKQRAFGYFFQFYGIAHKSLLIAPRPWAHIMIQLYIVNSIQFLCRLQVF